MINKLVSVILPAYNHDKYIQETIKSILNQTYKNIELLIINDGSSDSTLQKIQEMQDVCERRFARFVVESQENKGVCATLNRLHELAQGDFVYSTASDDILATNAIEELYNFLSQNKDYILSVGENKIIDKNGTQCYWNKNRNIVYNINECFYSSYSDYLMKWATNIDFFSDDFGSYPLLLLGNHVPNGCLVRKNIYEKTGYFTENAPLEDYYIFLQLAKYGKFKYIPKPLYYYRWYENNTVQQRDKVSKFAKITRRYEMELVKKSQNTKIKNYMKNYINSFPKNYMVKIPFIFELFKIKTPCVEQIKIKFLGLSFIIKNNNL